MKTSTRKRLWIAAVVLALYTITGFFVLPPIVRSQLEQRASAGLGRRVTVERVRLNPYSLSVTIEGLSIRELDGKTMFAGWRRLYVNFGAVGSLFGEWVLSDIALDGFTGHVAIDAKGALSFADILAKLQAPPAKPAQDNNAARPVRIGRLRVTDARLEFSDASRQGPFKTVLGPVAFALTNFRTVSREGAPYAFEAVTEAGERLAWSGTLQAQPLRSGGDFNVANIQLPKYAPYYADRLAAEVRSGLLSLHGHYDLDLTPGARVLKLRDGAVQLRNVQVRERGQEADAIEIPSLDVNGIEADGVAMKCNIDTISTNAGRIRIRRDHSGTINLLAMIPPSADAAPTATASSTTPPPATALPDVLIRQLALTGFTVDVTDLAGPRPAQLSLGDVRATVQSFTLKPGADIPVQLSFGWAPRGTVRLDGSVGLFPLKAALKTELANVEILPLSPYLEQFINARITQGAVSAALTLEAAIPNGQPLAASATGTLSVDKFGLVDGVHLEELAGFNSLSLHGIRVATAPQLTVAIEGIDVASPYARVLVNADKTINLALVAAAPGRPAASESKSPAAAAPTPTASPAGLPKIDIGKITIVDADYRFADRSVEPNVTMAINQFGGTITGLSSTNPAKADVDLKAAVDGTGPVTISGKLDPLGEKPALNLTIAARNVDLVPLSPYSGKYAGYELARGKLLLDVKVLVDGKKIDATNVMTLNQFTLGNHVESPDATKLPVRLGVALLKDTSGNIVIDIPVQGRTDDPSFKIGRVVLRVVVNLLTKAAVSPFSLLGAAFGGGGEELGYQEFVPGTSTLRADEQHKLDTLVKALSNRPGLSVDVEGSFDTAADAYALKRVKFDASVRHAVWEKHHLADPNIPPPDQLAITPEEMAATIQTMYDAKFPTGTQFGAPAAAAPQVVAVPPAPKGFLRRAAAVVTLQRWRQKHAAERQAREEAAKEHKAAAAAEAATGLPVEEMSSRLAETVVVDANDLRALAQARAQRVRDYFVSVGKIAPERLFLAKLESDPARAGKGPRVFLHLQ